MHFIKRIEISFKMNEPLAIRTVELIPLMQQRMIGGSKGKNEEK